MKIKKINEYDKVKYNFRNMINEKEEVELSILMPAYNSENTIERCINSILTQKTKYSFEIIIVNDGSTDNTEKIINQFKDNRIKLISQRNGGIAYTRNVLLSNANGRYIAFIDSDDFFEGNFIELMLNKAKKENLEFVKCNYKKVDSKNMNIIFESSYNKNSDIESLDGYVWGSIIEKDKYFEICFPDGYWFEDMINSLLIYPKITKYGIIEEYLYVYIDYPQSASKIQGKAKNIKNLEQLFLVDEIVNNYFELNKKINMTMYKKIKNELSVMLMFRTRKLDKRIRKECFLYSKKILEKIEHFENDTTFLAHIIRTENYVLWIIYCLFLKICQKIKK